MEFDASALSPLWLSAMALLVPLTPVMPPRGPVESEEEPVSPAASRSAHSQEDLPPEQAEDSVLVATVKPKAETSRVEEREEPRRARSPLPPLLRTRAF